MKEHNKTQGPKWQRDIVLFLSSQTLSLFGSSLVQYALIWYLTLTAQSGAVLTLAVTFGFLPTFLLSPFAGVWADRYNRKTLTMLADAVIALSTVFLILLFLAGYNSIGIILTAFIIRALGTAIQMPAVQAIVPQLVPEAELTRVNGWNTTLQSLVYLISPMISAAMLSFTRVEWIFMLDVVTAGLAVGILLFLLKIPSAKQAHDSEKVTYFTDLKLGWDYIRKHTFIKKLFFYFSIVYLMAAPVSFLTPLQVTRNYGGAVWRLSALEVIFSIGMMGGGLLISTWGGFRNRIHSIMFAMGTMGACTVALGLVKNFWVYLFFMGLIGVIMPLFITPTTVLLQEKVENNYLGRTFGVMTMLSTSLMPLGMLVFGPLADVVAIEWLLLFSGAFMCLGTLMTTRDQALLAAGEPKRPEES